MSSFINVLTIIADVESVNLELYYAQTAHYLPICSIQSLVTMKD